jgi:2-amino-4-hydroxy-6-hydroxymethyldihydropteridine diphosphokinase
VPAPVAACVALGSNLGDRRAHIDAAVAALRALPVTRLAAASAVIETEPVGPVRQGRFLNAAAVLETTLTARELLTHLQRIERSRGRERSTGERWGPRTLDLDLILFGDAVIDEPGLTVPHPRLHERRFVLEPTAQIAPHAVVPTLGRTVRQLLDALPQPAAAHAGTIRHEPRR